MTEITDPINNAQAMEYARRLNDIATDCEVDGEPGNAKDLIRIAARLAAVGGGWTCFFCNEHFTSRAAASQHFGAMEDQEPVCKIKSHEGHLVHYIRKLENDLRRYREDDSDVMRSIMVLESDHAMALQRAEELGYSRGVRDMTPTAVAGDEATGE